jgi:O-antigen/teichoic acid export membrane protein
LYLKMESNLLKNGLYNVIGLLISLGLSILTIPILIRLLGLEEYGLWVLVTTVIAIVGLAEAGLSVSTTVFLSRDLARSDFVGMGETLTVTFGGMLMIASAAAAGLALSANTLISLFGKLSETQQVIAAHALQIGGLVIWARLLQQVLVGILQAHRRYGITNSFTIVQSILTNASLLLAAWLSHDIAIMMEALAVVTLITFGALLIVNWRILARYRLRPRWNRAKVRDVARYSGLTWLVSLSSALFSQVDRIIVGAILGTAVLGVYAAITSITAKINSISAAPVQPLLPELTSILARPGVEHRRIDHSAKQALQVNAVIALGVGAALFVLAPLVMTIMISTAVSTETILAFRIAVVIYALYSVNAVGYYVLFSTNAVHVCMAIQIVSTILSLLAIAVLGSIFGLVGAAAGNAGYLGVFLLTVMGMRRLGIPSHSWHAWLQFPLTWFLIVITIASIMALDNLILSIAVVGLVLLVLFGWFLRAQQIKLIRIPNRLRI